ncbi:MAG TPA: hypothetical protein PKK43_13015, partial [Spirochaetota bacterium]|nr:hypothetical protein [Spirochaetota bacterium]
MNLQNGMIRLTILSNNIASTPYIAEHGFSLAIETENKLILFDSCQRTAVRNAAQAGIASMSSLTNAYLI